MAEQPTGGTTIERDSHAQQYVTVHNRVARDKRLRRASRGLLIEVLSLKPGTRITPETLAEGGPEGRDALRAMISELERYGYVVREKGQDARGRWTTRLIFRETPIDEAGSPTPEKPLSARPANTRKSPVQTDDGFSGVGKSGAKDLKDVDLKDDKDGGSPEADPWAPAGQMIEMVIGEIRNSTGATIGADVAEQIGRELLGSRATPPEHPLAWVRALLRADPNPRKYLPTPVPPRFTAPEPAPAPRAESIAAAREALAHIKRPAANGPGDPRRNLAAEQLAESRATRKQNEEAAA